MNNISLLLFLALFSSPVYSSCPVGDPDEIPRGKITSQLIHFEELLSLVHQAKREARAGNILSFQGNFSKFKDHYTPSIFPDDTESLQESIDAMCTVGLYALKLSSHSHVKLKEIYIQAFFEFIELLNDTLKFSRVMTQYKEDLLKLSPIKLFRIYSFIFTKVDKLFFRIQTIKYTLIALKMYYTKPKFLKVELINRILKTYFQYLALISICSDLCRKIEAFTKINPEDIPEEQI